MHYFLFVIVGFKIATTHQAGHGLSKGAVIGIVLGVIILIVLAVAVVVYKRRQISYHRGEKLMAGSSRFSNLKSRFGKTAEIPYREDVD